jgi:glycosyltransferase involved in cell wall biosynthesis
MSVPEVSVLINTYNRAATLRACIDSALAQTGPAKEILVVDDGSTDGSADLVRSYGAAVAYHPLPHRGLSRSRNAAIGLARGRWIAFLDSDDYYLYPQALADLRARFDEEPALDAVSGGWRVVGPGGDPRADVAPWEQAPAFDLESFLVWKPAFLSGKLFRREILERSGGFDPDFEAAMDTELILRLLLGGARIGWLRKAVNAYRLSPDAMMADAPREAAFLRRALDRTFAAAELPAAIRRREADVRYSTELWLAGYLWSRGFPADAAAAFTRARALRREEPFIQAKNWWRILRGNAQRTGDAPIPQEDFLAAALPAFSLPAVEGRRLAGLLDWWWNAWGPYAGETRGEKPVRPPESAAIVARTKRCIQAAKEPTLPAVVARFWSEAAARGWIRPEERAAVVTLYLACFTRSLAARKLRPAWDSLRAAVSATRGPHALAPWRRFLANAVRRLVPGPAARPEDGE